MINWKVRLQSKEFWLGIAGTVGAFIVSVASIFGITLDISGWTEAASSIIAGVFSVLALVGVISDPTTKGVSDSAQAMTYTSPKSDDKKAE